MRKRRTTVSISERVVIRQDSGNDYGLPKFIEMSIEDAMELQLDIRAKVAAHVKKNVDRSRDA